MHHQQQPHLAVAAVVGLAAQFFTKVSFDHRHHRFDLPALRVAAFAAASLGAKAARHLTSIAARWRLASLGRRVAGAEGSAQARSGAPCACRPPNGRERRRALGRGLRKAFSPSHRPHPYSSGKAHRLTKPPCDCLGPKAMAGDKGGGTSPLGRSRLRWVHAASLIASETRGLSGDEGLSRVAIERAARRGHGFKRCNDTSRVRSRHERHQ